MRKELTTIQVKDFKEIMGVGIMSFTDVCEWFNISKYLGKKIVAGTYKGVPDVHHELREFFIHLTIQTGVSGKSLEELESDDEAMSFIETRNTGASYFDFNVRKQEAEKARNKYKKGDDNG